MYIRNVSMKLKANSAKKFLTITSIPATLCSFSIGAFILTATLGVSSGWSADKTIPTVPDVSGKMMEKVSDKADALKGGGKDKKELVDINSASLDELTAIKGIDKADSEKIVKNRPYANKDELVSKKVIPQGRYDNIKGEIVAKLVQDTPSKATDVKSPVSGAMDSLTDKTKK